MVMSAHHLNDLSNKPGPPHDPRARREADIPSEPRANRRQDPSLLQRPGNGWAATPPSPQRSNPPAIKSGTIKSRVIKSVTTGGAGDGSPVNRRTGVSGRMRTPSRDQGRWRRLQSRHRSARRRGVSCRATARPGERLPHRKYCSEGEWHISLSRWTPLSPAVAEAVCSSMLATYRLATETRKHPADPTHPPVARPTRAMLRSKGCSANHFRSR